MLGEAEVCWVMKWRRVVGKDVDVGVDAGVVILSHPGLCLVLFLLLLRSVVYVLLLLLSPPHSRC